MDYRTILRMKTELKPFHKFNLFNRMLKASKGDLLVVFNNYLHAYEIHSVKSYMLTGDSQNALLREDELMNSYLIKDYLSRRLNKYGDDVRSEFFKLNHLYDQQEQKSYSDQAVAAGFKSIERALGRNL